MSAGFHVVHQKDQDDQSESDAVNWIADQAVLSQPMRPGRKSSSPEPRSLTSNADKSRKSVERCNKDLWRTNLVIDEGEVKR